MYRSEVQLTPQIHEGSLAHYWHIFLITDGHKITVQEGWATSYIDAYAQTARASKEYVK